MRCTFATVALAALAVANPVPQAVTSAISPQGSAPAGCQSSYDGTFQIQVIKAASKRDLAKRQDGALIITLKDGVMMDADGRTGYIAANNQFQFDGPPQAGAIYTAGWSVCSNGSIALGPDAIFYQCLSGTFYNLYDESTGAQCSPVYIDVVGSGSAAPAPSGGATQQTDGQVTASAVSQITDGQPQAPTAVVTQITDGQPQAPTAVVTQITDGQPQAPTGVVTQITDGQPQAPTGVVTQITDGQPQAPTGVVTQITDGQPQAPTGVVTQITDGQPQAPTGVVTQISDGQVQAPTVTPGCSEYVDGQPQCSAASTGIVPSYGANTTIAQPTVSVTPATGAAPANNFGNSIFGLIAGVVAVAFL